MSFLILAKYQKAYELRKETVKLLSDLHYRLPGSLPALKEGQVAFEKELIKLSEQGDLTTPFLRFIFGKE
jgi:hypothetical protein